MSSSGESDSVVCPGCAEACVESAEFCPSCGAPIGPYVGLDPIKRVFAEAYVVGHGSQCPQNRLVLVGMWLICGITGVGGLVSIGKYLAFSSYAYPASWHEGFNLALYSPIWFIYAVLLYRATRNYFRSRVELDEAEPG